MHHFQFTHLELADISTLKAAIARQYKGALLDGPLHLEVKAMGFDVAADVPLREIEEALAGKVFWSRGQIMSVAVDSMNTAAADLGKAVEVKMVSYVLENCQPEQWEAMNTEADNAVFDTLF